MSLNSLFDQFLRSGHREPGQGGGHTAESGMADMIGKLTKGPAGGLAGGIAAGGLLGVLVGNKKARKAVGKVAGGAVAYGGSAVLGALALKAFQNWQSNKSGPTGGSAATVVNDQAAPLALPSPEKFDPALNTDSTGQPMQLALIKAMVAAANADGHIDQKEQAAVFDAVDRMELDGESKALIFDVMRKPPGISEIAHYAASIEQASELYLASRLAIDPDQAVERQYLDSLARTMNLPSQLVYEIEMQVDPQNTVQKRTAAVGRDTVATIRPEQKPVLSSGNFMAMQGK